MITIVSSGVSLPNQINEDVYAFSVVDEFSFFS